MRRGDVAASGIASNKGENSIARTKHNPPTTALRPVFAPALIPAPDSGLINIGGPEKAPLITVMTPHITYSHRPLGTEPVEY